MNFFFDNPISQKLAEAMNLLEEGEGTVRHLTDLFPGDAKDETWLKYVGEHNLILITRDKKIQKHPMQRMELRRHKIGAFFLTGKIMTKWQGIRQLISSWEEIKRLNAETNKPYAFQIRLKGRIQRLEL